MGTETCSCGRRRPDTCAEFSTLACDSARARLYHINPNPRRTLAHRSASLVLAVVVWCEHIIMPRARQMTLVCGFGRVGVLVVMEEGGGRVGWMSNLKQQPFHHQSESSRVAGNQLTVVSLALGPLALDLFSISTASTPFVPCQVFIGLEGPGWFEWWGCN